MIVSGKIEWYEHRVKWCEATGFCYPVLTMNLINTGDFIDLMTKAYEFGPSYLSRRLLRGSKGRVINTWQRQIDIPVANWRQIPAVREWQDRKLNGGG